MQTEIKLDLDIESILGLSDEVKKNFCLSVSAATLAELEKERPFGSEEEKNESFNLIYVITASILHGIGTHPTPDGCAGSIETGVRIMEGIFGRERRISLYFTLALSEQVAEFLEKVGTVIA